MTTAELTMMVGAILTSDDGSLMERIEYATAKIDAHIAEREAALVERIIASLRHTAHDGKWQNVDEAEIIIREAARRPE